MYVKGQGKEGIWGLTTNTKGFGKAIWMPTTV